MRAWLPVCLLFGGCAQLAGIDDTSGDGRLGLSLVIEHRSIGSTIVRTPQNLSASSATYLITDPADPAVVTPLPAEEIQLGTWGADVFDATPAVVFDLPDNPGPSFDRQIELPSKNLLTSFDVLEHPAPTVSALTDTIAVNTTLDVATVGNETFELFVVGTWTSLALPTPAVGTTTLAPPAFQIGTMARLTGRPHETITLDDTPLVLRRVGATLNGVFEPAPFAQVAANTLSGALTTIQLDQMLNAQIDQAGATAKLGVVRPAITAGPAFSFDVTSAPGAAIGNTAGPRLTSGVVATMDVALTAAFANPFASKGWAAVLTYTAAGSRTLTPTGETLPVTLGAGMQQVADDPQAVAMLDFPAPVPELVELDGESLSIDNATIPRPVAPVEITMVVDPATLYSLEVRELVPNAAATALEPRLILSAVSDTPSFTIQPEVFEAGKLYSLRVRTIDGLFTDVATGDLRTSSLPFATAFVDVGIFRVAP
jgi:hypothetical protein